MNIFAKLIKVDTQRREIHGVMVAEEVDRAGEVFDYSSSRPYVLAWSQELQRASGGQNFGNVRGQHGKIAAGKLVGISFNDLGKRIEVRARIVDDNEWQKCVEGVYTGFSIGGSYVKKWADGATIRYTAKPSEVSVVDLPCGPSAGFELVKSDGQTEQRNFRNGSAAGKPGNQFHIGGVDRPDVAKEELTKARLNPIGLS